MSAHVLLQPRPWGSLSCLEARERESCTTTFVCLYCLSFAAWFTVEHLLFSLSFCEPDTLFLCRSRIFPFLNGWRPIIMWWTKPRRGVISMIWITVTRKFENQNSKLQVEVSTQVSCLYANRKKRIPSFQSSFKLSVMKDICLIHRAAPLRRFLLSLWRVFSSSLKSLHIL